MRRKATGVAVVSSWSVECGEGGWLGAHMQRVVVCAWLGRRCGSSLAFESREETMWLCLRAPRAASFVFYKSMAEMRNGDGPRRLLCVVLSPGAFELGKQDQDAGSRRGKSGSDLR